MPATHKPQPDLASQVMDLMAKKNLNLRIMTKNQTWDCKFQERAEYIKTKENSSGTSTPDSEASSAASIHSQSSDAKGKEIAH